MTIANIKKALNKNIVKANATLNGKQAYRIEGSFALLTKADLEDMVYA